ncbi:MAG: glycine/betaine ABC transporter substrate-binding protein [Nitriliruptorales bacterium]|nr:glycine/betaine ABC transporter substrate-binding protein [Nitriliruptorales bacterium]
MQRHEHRPPALLALLLTITLFAAACGTDDGAAEPPGEGEPAPEAEAVADNVDLGGVALTAGSKEFTEQRILGQISVVALQAAGADVSDQTGLQGTDVVRGALENEEIDLYWEYTGTGWINILGEDTPEEGEEAQYEAVRDRDLEENGIVWLDPAPMNNTYAFFTSPNADLGLETISDMAEFAEQNADEATLCAATEFLVRDDGLPGVEETYGFEFPSGNISELDLNLAIDAATEGEECVIGEIFATDGRIVASDLTLLEDDQEFFAPYNLSMTMREETYQENAEAYDELFGAISELLTDDVMQELNARVDVDGESEEDVARDFLTSNGIISG